MKVAVIGLGTMGSAMAKNLHKAGKLDYAWNRDKQRSQRLAAQTSMPIADSLVDIGKECDCIIISVSADNDVREVLEVLLPYLKPGSVIIDTSTIRASTAISLSRLLAENECYFLDAPVSGGVEGARNGELVFMVGGDETALAKVRPVLEILGKQVVWLGESGNGQATKAVNQIMAAGINQAVTEALAFAEAMDLPMDRVIDVITGGAAGNWFLQKRGSSMTQGRFEAGFKIALHKKDLDICRDMVVDLLGEEVRLPLIEMTRLHYDRLIEQGHAENDISALYRLKQKMFYKK